MTVWIWVSNSRDTTLSPSIHSLIGQPISSLDVFPQRVPDLEMLKPPHQLLRLVVQLAEFGMTHFIDAFHLPHHQFGIANHLERFDLVFGSVAQRGKESLILGIVIGAVPKVFAKLGDRVPGGIPNGDTVAGRSGIAAGSAINVSSVSGSRGFRRGEKIARIGRERRHQSSLQRGVARLMRGCPILPGRIRTRYLPVASRVANRCGKLAASIFSCATRRL